MRFNWRELPQLTTPRLTLRAIAANDDDDLLAIYGDSEVMQFASDPPFGDRAQIAQLRASVQRLFTQRVSLEWGIVLNQDTRLVGTCGLHSFTPDGHQAEIGCLLARAQWGQGIMTEALQTVIHFGFQTLALQVILADIEVLNQRSLALFDRLGFQLVDQSPQPSSVIWLKLLNPEFQRNFP
jgi:[ribosomal protein S5]-alanine N-acetyltransferase